MVDGEKELRIPIHRVRWGRIALIVVVLLAVSFLIVRPGVIGFGVIDNNNLTNDTAGLLSAPEGTANKEIKSLSKQELIIELEKIRTNISTQDLLSGALINQVNEVNKELTDCKVGAERLTGEKESLQKDIQGKDDELSKAAQEKQQAIDTRVQELTMVLTEEKTACEQKSAAKDANVTTALTNYGELVKNTVHSVCCKAKVDNPNIAAYDVTGNKVVCLESGANVLVC